MTDFEASFPPLQFEREIHQLYRLIRQGSADDFHAMVTTRVTFPPLQLEIIRVEIECRG